MTYLAVAPFSTIGHTVIATSFGSAAVEVMRITVDRTGYWAAAGAIHVGGGSGEGGGFNVVLDLRYAGVSQGTRSFGVNANSNNYGIGIVIGSPPFLTAGQTISIWASKGFSNVHTIDQQFMQAWFLPTQAYLK